MPKCTLCLFVLRAKSSEECCKWVVTCTILASLPWTTGLAGSTASAMDAENDDYFAAQSDCESNDESDDEVQSLAALCHDVQMNAIFDGQCARLCSAPGSDCLDLLYIESLWQEAAVEDAPVDDAALLHLLRCAAHSQDDPQAEFEGMKHITLSCVSAAAALGCSIVTVEKCPGVLRSPPSLTLATPRTGESSTLEHLHIIHCNPVNAGVDLADGVLGGVRALVDASRTSLQSLLLPGNNWPQQPLSLSAPWPQLEALDLSGSSFERLQLGTCEGGAPPLLPELRELSLRRCDHLLPADVYALLQHSPVLTHLDVSGIAVQWAPLVSALQGCTQLVALAAGNCQDLWSDSATAAASMPMPPPLLQLLTLAACNMHDEHLSTALGVKGGEGGGAAVCKHLEMLDISGNYDLTVQGVAGVVAAHMHAPPSAKAAVAAATAAASAELSCPPCEEGASGVGVQCVVIAESSLLEAPLRGALVQLLTASWGGDDAARGAAGDAVAALEVEIHGQNMFWQAM